MKSISKIKRIMSAAFHVIAMTLVVMPLATDIYASTRTENVQKIREYLNTSQVAEKLQKEGRSQEQIMTRLNSFSDAQVESLAQHATVQVGGALDDDGTSTWLKLYGLYILASIVTVLLLVAIA